MSFLSLTQFQELTWSTRRMDDMFKSASTTAECIKASPQVSDLVHSPFTTRLGATMFDYYDKNPQHAARFAKAMAGVTTSKSGTFFFVDNG